MTHVTLNVPNIECEHCEQAVKTALTPLAGVRSIQVDIPRKLVHLEYDEAALSLDRVKSTLAEEDYPVASVTPG